MSANQPPQRPPGQPVASPEPQKPTAVAPVAQASGQAASKEQATPTLNDLLVFMASQMASDLHLKPMRPPLIRVKGKLLPVKAAPLKPADLEAMLLPLLNPKQREHFDLHLSVDFGYGVPGVARFRGNLYMQRGTVGAVFRRIPIDIKDLDSLELPDGIRDLTEVTDGLVLVTGPTGSGKSTTLAAMILEISRKEPVHIVTVEDPIEFLFQDKVAAISQREVGTDTPAFREALRNAMRQDPDVIMVGEMRDIETITTVLTAAETGHIVYSTLHTNNASQTIDRIIDAFPSDQHKQVRAQLGLVLKGIISLKLVRTKDGSLTAAVEILKTSPKIAKLIEDGLTKEIHEEMERSVSYYRMQSMNQSLLALLVHQRITYQDAMELATDPEDLSLKLRKMFPEIEDRARKGGKDMAPSQSDFSQIESLMEIKQAYDEQEDRFRSQLLQRDEAIEQLKHDLEYQVQALRERAEGGGVKDDEIRKLRADNERVRAEAQTKITQLQERIKELNQKLMGK